MDNDNLYSKLLPIISGKNLQAEAIRPSDTLNDNLKLVAGHLSMSDFDIQVTAGLLATEGGFLQFTTQFVGAFKCCGEKNGSAKSVSPYFSGYESQFRAMNRSILMSSDYF